MLDYIPSKEEMEQLLGKEIYQVWCQVSSLVTNYYNMEELWNTGGKNWTYEYKFRRGGRTLCTLYAKEHYFGFMIIFGKAEREKFELERETFSPEILEIYDSATTYHDGKWMMIELCDLSLLENVKHLLFIKRKPNRK